MNLRLPILSKFYSTSEMTGLLFYLEGIDVEITNAPNSIDGDRMWRLRISKDDAPPQVRQWGRSPFTIEKEGKRFRVENS